MKNLFRKMAVTVLTAAVGVCAISFANGWGNGWDNAFVEAQADEPLDGVTFVSDSSTQGIIRSFFSTESEYTKISVSDSVPESIADKDKKELGNGVWIYGDSSTNTVYIAPAVKGTKIYAPEDSSFLFTNCYSFKECDLSGLDWSRTKNMSYMIYCCSCLESVSLNGWNTSSVENMGNMFYYCRSLESVDLSGINTSSVVNMAAMFAYCGKLTDVDFGSVKDGTRIDTSNVTDFSQMFYECTSLQKNYLAELDLSSAKYIGSFYYGCDSFEKIDLSGLSFPKVEDVYGIFSSCENLTEVSLKNTSFPVLTAFGSCFSYCNKLNKVDMSGIKAENVKSTAGLFQSCSALKTIDFTGTDFENLLDMATMFSGCSSLTSIDLSDFSFKNVKIMSYTFQNCTKLESVDFSGCSFDSVQVVYGLFYYCSGLKSIDFSDTKLSNVSSFESMFKGCSSLESVDFSNVEIPVATTMAQMFSGCTNLKSVSFAGTDTSKITSFEGMFKNCTGLDDTDFANLGLDTSSATSMKEMFSGCTGAVSMDLSSFELGKVTDISYMFDHCSNLEEVKWNASELYSVKNMSEVFYFCPSLKSADFSGVVGGKDFDIRAAFYYDTALEKINLCSVDFHGLSESDVNNAFTGCSSLKEICMSKESYKLMTSFGHYTQIQVHEDANSDNFCDICKCYLGRQEYLAGTSLMLGSRIGVNFYFGLSDEVCADKGAYVKFSLPDGTEQTVYVKDAQVDDKVVPGEKYYVFPCYIMPVNYQDDVKAKLYLSDGSAGGEIYTFNLEQYAAVITTDTADIYSRECKDLVEAMIDYCYYDAKYFVNRMPGDPKSFNTMFTEVYNTLLPESNLPIEDRNFVGASLITNSQLILRLYFNNDFEGSCGQKGDYYYVQYAVAPTQFDVKDPIAGYSVNDYLCYCCSSSQNSRDQWLSWLCVSLYRYEMAAKAYQASIE